MALGRWGSQILEKVLRMPDGFLYELICVLVFVDIVLAVNMLLILYG